MTRLGRQQSDVRHGRPAREGSQVVGAPRWLLRFEERPDASVRLLCFPHAGGAAVGYREWAFVLSAQTEVLAVELPGHGSRLLEPPIDRMDVLVEHLLAILNCVPERPCVLFGHSFGAILAFEVARALRALGRATPRGLIVSACAAPQLIASSAQRGQRSDQDLLAELSLLDGTPPAVLADLEMATFFLPAFHADSMMLDHYSYPQEHPLDVPIAVLGGRSDPLANEESLAAWKSHTTARFSIHMFSGGHFYFQSQRDAVLEALEQELRRIVDELP